MDSINLVLEEAKMEVKLLMVKALSSGSLRLRENISISTT
jgi:hypothetical protein